MGRARARGCVCRWVLKSSPLLNGLRISCRAHRNNFLNSFSIAYVFGQIHTVSIERERESNSQSQNEAARLFDLLRRSASSGSCDTEFLCLYFQKKAFVS